MRAEASEYGLATPTPVLPSPHEMLDAFDHPALLTDAHHQLHAFNRQASRLLDISTADLGAPLSSVVAARCAGCPALGELLEHGLAADEEVAAPVALVVRGEKVEGIWGIRPLTTSGHQRFYLHRLYPRRDEDHDRSGMDFLANVTHELRTPLSALVATTEVMLQDYRSITLEELGQMIGLLHRNTRRLEALVGNLLDAAGLQNGRFQLRKTASSVGSLVRDASDFVVPLLNNKNQRLEVRVLGHMPALVVDPKRITGVLVNLLSNASRYGLPNEPIQMIISNEGKVVRFTVRQRGPGIPRPEQALVFQRFYRASTGEKVSGGTGLGLAIVKDVVEMHGGTVGVISKPGKSTAFWFTLPIEGAVG